MAISPIQGKRMPEKYNLLSGVEPPTPDQIRAVRLDAGLSQAECARIIGAAERYRWSEYERGIHAIDLNRWAVFLLSIDRHPIYSLKAAGKKGR